MERIQDRHIRWLLEIDWKTPREYMVRKEVQRNLLRNRTGQRAWRFEERLERGESNAIAKLCWKEIRERDRIRYYEEKGVKVRAEREERSR